MKPLDPATITLSHVEWRRPHRGARSSHAGVAWFLPRHWAEHANAVAMNRAGGRSAVALSVAAAIALVAIVASTVIGMPTTHDGTQALLIVENPSCIGNIAPSSSVVRCIQHAAAIAGSSSGRLQHAGPSVAKKTSVPAMSDSLAQCRTRRVCANSSGRAMECTSFHATSVLEAEKLPWQT